MTDYDPRYRTKNRWAARTLRDISRVINDHIQEYRDEVTIYDLICLMNGMGAQASGLAHALAIAKVLKINGYPVGELPKDDPEDLDTAREVAFSFFTQPVDGERRPIGPRQFTVVKGKRRAVVRVEETEGGDTDPSQDDDPKR